MFLPTVKTEFVDVFVDGTLFFKWIIFFFKYKLFALVKVRKLGIDLILQINTTLVN